MNMELQQLADSIPPEPMKWIIQLVSTKNGTRSKAFVSTLDNLKDQLQKEAEKNEAIKADYILLLDIIGEDHEPFHINPPLFSVESFLHKNATHIDHPNKLNGNAPEELK